MYSSTRALLSTCIGWVGGGEEPCRRLCIAPPGPCFPPGIGWVGGWVGGGEGGAWNEVLDLVVWVGGLTLARSSDSLSRVMTTGLVRWVFRSNMCFGWVGGWAYLGQELGFTQQSNYGHMAVMKIKIQVLPIHNGMSELLAHEAEGNISLREQPIIPLL